MTCPSPMSVDVEREHASPGRRSAQGKRGDAERTQDRPVGGSRRSPAQPSPSQPACAPQIDPACGNYLPTRRWCLAVLRIRRTQALTPAARSCRGIEVRLIPLAGKGAFAEGLGDLPAPLFCGIEQALL